jgi:DsbC/DsbD-like thiol-disulfide interchange protein
MCPIRRSAFPRPTRQDDGYSRFAGYDEPVALALSFPVDDPDGRLGFTADVFLGVCETICIPVQATLRSCRRRRRGNMRGIVAEAFGRLPAKDQRRFRRPRDRGRDGRLIVEVRLPEGAGEAELFVVSTASHMLGQADTGRGSGVVFASHANRPGGSWPGATSYTLVTEAVAGL